MVESERSECCGLHLLGCTVGRKAKLKHTGGVYCEKVDAATRRLAKGRVYVSTIFLGLTGVIQVPHSYRVSMVPHTSKRARVDAPDDEDADAAAVAAAEEDLQCPVCYDLPEGIVNQVRRTRLPPCPASLLCLPALPPCSASLPCLPAHLPNLTTRRSCRSALTDTSYAPSASWKSRRAATSARNAVSRTVIKRFETFTDRRSSTNYHGPVWIAAPA